MNTKNLEEKRLDAQIHPDKYSDEELDELLFSQDTMSSSEDGDAVILLKRSFAYDEAKNSIDVGEEWKKFEKEQSLNDSETKGKIAYLWRNVWTKVAAIFVGLLMLSGISYAAFHIAKLGKMEPTKVLAADSVKVTLPAKAKMAIDQPWEKVEPGKVEPVIFEDAELATILKYIADKTHIKIEYRNAEAAHVRFYLQWENKDSLKSIIDKINHFEKVHVTFDEAAQVLIVE